MAWDIGAFAFTAVPPPPSAPAIGLGGRPERTFSIGQRVLCWNRQSAFSSQYGTVLDFSGDNFFVRLDGMGANQVRRFRSFELNATPKPSSIDYSRAVITNYVIIG